MEDYLYKFLTLYNHLPHFIKQFIGIIYNNISVKIRYGPFYKAYIQRLDYINSLDNVKQVIQRQEQILFDQVNISIENVPFYRKYEKCKSIETFQNYPIIDKKIILKFSDEMVSNWHKSKKLLTNTGGSSGTPMEFFLERGVSRSKEKAHFDWYWGQFGYKPNDKILMIRGLPLRNNKFYEYDTIKNVLNLSCYNLNEDNILLILNRINRFKPLFIHAYPSSLKIVTSLLENHAHLLHVSLKAIFLGSEHLFDTDRDYFEHFYNSKVVNWYGHTERLVHGGNCPFSNEFHFYPAYGYTELLDENDKIITVPGREGRIVATGFDNNVMPFIRYNTGDIGVLSGVLECKCGFKGMTLSRIVGRDQDVIFLTDNTKVSLTAFIFGQHLDAFNKITEMQVIQEQIGKIEIKIVKNSSFIQKDEDSLVQALINSVNNKLQVKISYVDIIQKTSRGKNIFFISRLKLDEMG